MNPFYSGFVDFGGKRRWLFDVTAEDRIRRVKKFDADECRDALRVKGLQKTVRLAVHRRQRALQKEAQS